MRGSGLLHKAMVVFLLALTLFAVGAIAHASSEDAVWPESSGEVVQQDGKLVIDATATWTWAM